MIKHKSHLHVSCEFLEKFNTENPCRWRGFLLIKKPETLENRAFYYLSNIKLVNVIINVTLLS
jgi:hypothetical protein